MTTEEKIQAQLDWYKSLSDEKWHNMPAIQLCKALKICIECLIEGSETANHD